MQSFSLLSCFCMVSVILSELLTTQVAAADSHSNSSDIVNGGGNVFPVMVGSESTIVDLQLTPIWNLHRFYPSSISISEGDTIVFIFKTQADHTVSWSKATSSATLSGDHSHQPPLVYMNGTVSPFIQPININMVNSTAVFTGDADFSSGARNAKYRDAMVRFNKAGVYQFFCAFHPHMVMNITVLSKSQAASGSKAAAAALIFNDAWRQIEQDRKQINEWINSKPWSFVKELDPASIGMLRTVLAKVNATSQGTGVSKGEISSESISADTLPLLYYSLYNASGLPSAAISYPTFGLIDANNTNCANNKTGTQGSRSHTVLTGIDLMFPTNSSPSIAIANSSSASSTSTQQNQTTSLLSSPRFFPSFLKIRKGDTITFNSSLSMAPHIVIFNNTGVEPCPILITPSADQQQQLMKDKYNSSVVPLSFNTSFLLPISSSSPSKSNSSSGLPTSVYSFNGKGLLTSGVLLPPNETLFTTPATTASNNTAAQSPINMLPTSFTVKFDTVGLFRFVDGMFESQGMNGWVMVTESDVC